jgi:hypothetical protein
MSRRNHRARRRGKLVAEATSYRVTLRRPGAPDRNGVMETRLPCNVGDVLPGILRDDHDRLHPFTGRVLERAATAPSHAAMLVMGPHDLPLKPPFDPD